MSNSEAEALLREFLEDGKANIDIVIAHANYAGVVCDYSIESLPAFLHWAFSEMKTIPREPDPGVPEWIRSTDDYKRGLFDFDDRSKNLICFAAFYLGECFVRTYPQLLWAVGNREYSTGNMPVVTGFMYGKELAPMMAINNLFARIVAKPGRISDIDRTGANWEKYIA